MLLLGCTKKAKKLRSSVPPTCDTYHRTGTPSRICYSLLTALSLHPYATTQTTLANTTCRPSPMSTTCVIHWKHAPYGPTTRILDLLPNLSDRATVCVAPVSGTLADGTFVASPERSSQRPGCESGKRCQGAGGRILEEGLGLGSGFDRAVRS